MLTELVLIRHAHRDTTDRHLDNGLSKKGHEQAAKLLKLYEEGTLPPSEVFWTSPKKRCEETLRPIAKSKLKVEPSLDEQNEAEPTYGQFYKRLSKFAEKLNGAEPETIYLCSHGDVIPALVDLLCGQSVDLSKGGYAILKKKHGTWKLKS